MKKTVIFIKMNKYTRAAYIDDTHDPIWILYKVMDIIDTFNKHFINSLEDNDIIAYYLLNGENEYGTKNADKCALTYGTFQILKEKDTYVYNKLMEKEVNDELGIVTLNIKDISGSLKSVNSGLCSGIIIDFDIKRIITNNFHKEYTKEEYCTKNEIKLVDFDEMSYPIIDININNFSFNELEDLLIFVRMFNIWRTNFDDYMYEIA